MISLTESQWSEIYYALTSKISSVSTGMYGREADDGRWVSDLQAIVDAIGPDGKTAFEQGCSPGQ